MRDNRHEVMVRVTVLDTVTGEQHVDDRASTWSWTDGNWSCDCNRWPAPYDQVHGTYGVCEGANRFLAVSVEPLLPGYALHDFNSEYPPELIAKHLPISGRNSGV